MCRLFGLHAGRSPVDATFWLLEAPDSLLAQSHRNPDGFGIGTFEPDGSAELDKLPLAAHVAELFAREAREETSTTFVAHVRYASVGALSLENTHPFVMDNRIFGHNGVIGDLERVEAELGDLRSELHGTTDSERFFALVTKRIRDHDGDCRAGIVSAVRWLAENVELYSLNFVMATADELWALRYPEGNELWVLDRRRAVGEDLDEQGAPGEIAVHVPDAADQWVVVIASEQMDDDARWKIVEPGQLVRVDADLCITRETIVDTPPAHLMELTGRAAASQAQEELAAEH